MRRLLAVVLVLALVVAGLALVADLVLTDAAEERVATRAGEELGAPAEVDIRGWPVTLRVLAGYGVPHVSIRARSVPAAGGTLDRVDVTLTDVALDLADVRTGITELPPAASATFEAVAGEEALREMVPLPEGLVGLTLGGGRAHIDVAGVATIEATVYAEDGMVVFEPQSPLAALVGLARVPVDLSDRPGGPYVEEVEVTEGALVLRGRLAELESREAPGE